MEHSLLIGMENKCTIVTLSVLCKEDYCDYYRIRSCRILSLLIIGVVVAQKSKTQGMGAGFGGGAEDLFGSRARGMDALLSKLTIILSIAFAICTLILGRLMNTY